MIEQAAFLKRKHMSLAIYALAERWMKGRQEHAGGLEMMVKSWQMFVLCYLFRKLSVIAFPLDTVGRNGYEASIILRILGRPLLYVQGLFTPHYEDWRVVRNSKSV
jgi:hypothetical protein